MNIYIHDPGLQALTALSLISTLHKSPQHILSSFQLVSSLAVPCQWLLTVEILQLHALRSFSQSTVAPFLLSPALQGSSDKVATTFHGPSGKHRFQQSLHCCRGVFAEPLPMNWLYNTVVYSTVAMSVRPTTVSSAGGCLLPEVSSRMTRAEHILFQQLRT
jgi:hypothetical protein